jgi:hypothetical protein
MCAVCVAQGVTYVGGALASLQVMAARAKAKRKLSYPPEVPDSPTEAPDPEPELARQ